MGARRNAVIACVAGVATLALLLLIRSEPEPAFPRDEAVGATRANPKLAAFLAEHEPSKVRVIPLDNLHWRVTFQDGPRALLDAAVNADGEVAAFQVSPPGQHRVGSSIVWHPLALAFFACIFIAAVAVSAPRALRNLDAIVVGGGFTAAAALYDARLPSAEIYVATLTLAYVATRGTWIGLHRGRSADDRPALLDIPAAVRLLPVGLGAMAVAAALVTLSSSGASDVAYASLAGATLLADGILPYGSLAAQVVHGDTYPLLAYAWYVPAALLSPVRDAFDSLDGALVACAIALLGSAWILSRLTPDRHAGRLTALAWLAFPPVLLAASTGGNDLLVAALVAGALLTFARPALAALLLALAAWTKIVPGVALLFWGARRASLMAQGAIAAAVSLVVAGVLIAYDGWAGVSASVDAIRFQAERGSWYSIWQQTGAQDLQPVFQAGVVAFIVYAAFDIRRRDTDVTLARSAALAAAAIALIQISANYWTFTYLPWLVPFILVGFFPPAPRRSLLPEQRAP